MNADFLPLEAVYRRASREFGLGRRAIQWYATQGYIPKPQKKGREAFHRAGVMDWIGCLALMQKELGLSLPDAAGAARAISGSEGMLAYLAQALRRLGDAYPVGRSTKEEKLHRLVRMKLAMELVGWHPEKDRKAIDPDAIATEFRHYYGRFRQEEI